MEKPALISAISLFALAGCQAPTVNLATNEPIKVNIDMRLDVFQHQTAGGAKPGGTPAPPPASDPEAARRNRMADVQQFKNNALVGEGRDGLLVIRQTDLAGDYGDYVRKTVAAENADRMALMKAEAERDKISLPEIQKKQAALWVNRSFKGEWIEVQKPDSAWEWVQKQ